MHCKPKPTTKSRAAQLGSFPSPLSLSVKIAFLYLPKFIKNPVIDFPLDLSQLIFDFFFFGWDGFANGYSLANPLDTFYNVQARDMVREAPYGNLIVLGEPGLIMLKDTSLEIMLKDCIVLATPLCHSFLTSIPTHFKFPTCFVLWRAFLYWFNSMVSADKISTASATWFVSTVEVLVINFKDTNKKL